MEAAADDDDWWIVQRDNSAIILQVQDYRLLWYKAQSNYKDHNLKAVTWNNIRKSVEWPGLCQINPKHHKRRIILYITSMYPMLKHNIPMNTKNSGGQILKYRHNCMLGNCACFLLPPSIIQNKLFQKYSFLNTIRKSNSMNSEFVGAWSRSKAVCKVHQQTTHTEKRDNDLIFSYLS